jgi:NAD(P)-dependent dehydrogenase (short-subunit alcohol dehydrogenase family)
MDKETVLIVGAGTGISASLARLCASEGMQVMLAARNVDKLADLAAETKAVATPCDAGDPAQVAALFSKADAIHGPPSLVVYNASGRYRKPIQEIDPQGLSDALRVSAYGGFLVAQQAAIRMQARGNGTILFTGATASVKGMAGSTPFAMGKFALRGLAQCLARELAPQNIHVAHFIIDGGVATSREPAAPDQWLEPDAIAREYLHAHRQHRSAWTWEVELRPWLEKF